MMTDEPNGAPDLSAELSADELRIVVEFQRLELNRLLKENRRLDRRVDALMRLQEREQVLRQQSQAVVERLAGGAAPSNGAHGLESRVRVAEDRLDTLKHAVGRLVACLERRQRGLLLDHRASLAP